MSGAVVFVGDGKGSDALEPFWQRVRRSRKIEIETVAIDSPDQVWGTDLTYIRLAGGFAYLVAIMD